MVYADQHVSERSFPIGHAMKLDLRERRYIDAVTGSLFLLAVLAFHNGNGAACTVAASIGSLWLGISGARAYCDSRTPPADPPCEKV